MNEEALHVVVLSPTTTDRRVARIAEQLERFGLQVSASPLAEATDGEVRERLSDADAVVAAITTGAMGDEVVIRAYHDIADSAGSRLLVLALDPVPPPSPLADAPVFPDHGQNVASDSDAEALTAWIRAAVEARRAAEAAMPDESLKRADNGQSNRATAAADDERATTGSALEGDAPETASPGGDGGESVSAAGNKAPPPGEANEAPTDVDARERAEPDDAAGEPASQQTRPARRVLGRLAAPLAIGMAIALFLAGRFFDRDVVVFEGDFFTDALDQQYRVGPGPGPFDMGGDLGDEQPVHPVELDRPFLIATREVSNALYDEYLADAANQRAPPDPFVDELEPAWPAVNVSHDDAVGFAAWYSVKAGGRYRLPTEAEWEFVAREVASVLDSPCSYVNFLGGYPMLFLAPSTNNLTADATGDGTEAAVGCGSETAVLIPVDGLNEDPLGLYNLYGNAAEWVQDCYEPGYEGAPADGSAYERGGCDYRVFRGGSWLSPLAVITPTFRAYAPRDYRDYQLGFRLVRDLDWLDLYALDRPGTDWNLLLSRARTAAWIGAGCAIALFLWLIVRRSTGRRKPAENADSRGAPSG